MRDYNVFGYAVRDLGRPTDENRVTTSDANRGATVHSRLELVSERFFVHEDIIVMVLAIKDVFQLLHAGDDAMQFSVSG